MKHYQIIIFSLLFCSNVVNSGFSDYVSTVSGFFGYKNDENVVETDLDEFAGKIPYEVSTVDEKFITEAIKLTGVAISELDSCQQRVVLKLKSECHSMNDEQLAKLAVHLLNCQSSVEGRKIYPCTDEMPIKDCTITMDSDTWTSYHLMSNRARAVCYSIRQSQFKGLAEQTVNKLMDSAKNQLKTLGQIAHNQGNIREIAETTYEKLTTGHDHLSKQQEDLRKAQFQGQLAIEDNIQRLITEKRLIMETHNQLVQMTKSVQEKLDNSAKEIDYQSIENKNNHKELISDLLEIQNKARDIFERIDESADLLMKQNEDFKKQYKSTLENLAEVNKTVHTLVVLVGGTRQALEERLSWITTALGGTDLAVERLYLFVWHFVFVMFAMLGCAFLTARLSTRIAVISLPPLNLALALYGDGQHLDPPLLAAAIGAFILIQYVILFALNWKPQVSKAIPWVKEKLTPTKNPTTNGNFDQKVESSSSYTYQKFANETNFYETNEEDEDDEVGNLTPPSSRNGFYSPRSPLSRSRSNTPLKLNGSLRSECHATTRSGTPCKLSAVVGRQYCFRHQTGNSVIG